MMSEMSSKDATRLGVDLAKSEYLFVSQLVSIRKHHGIGVPELAESMGVKPQEIYDFENPNSGVAFPSLDFVHEYSRNIGAYVSFFAVPAETPGRQALLDVARNYVRKLLGARKGTGATGIQEAVQEVVVGVGAQPLSEPGR